MANKRKKNSYIPKSFESTQNRGDTSSNIYMSMLQSDAFKALNARQRDLYTHCKSQYYGERKHLIKDLHEIEPDAEKQLPYFTMNWWKVNTFFAIYTNQNTFRSDMNKLIEVGLIDCVNCGAFSRTKSIYRFSDRWRTYGTDEFTIPESVKTVSMRRKEKKA